jgi:N-acyl-L-homoserine lactone synthetase
MFNLISPKKRAEFKSDLDQMFTLLKEEFGDDVLDQYDHSCTQYLVYYHKKYGVIGGARLIPIEAPILTGELIKRIQFQPKQKIWELSRIFFRLPADNTEPPLSHQYELMRRDFFQNLYDSLRTISIAQKIKAFVTILQEDTHKEVLQMGLWPFDKQAMITSPVGDDKQYIVGYMTMNNDTYEIFTQRRLSFERFATVS